MRAVARLALRLDLRGRGGQAPLQLLCVVGDRVERIRFDSFRRVRLGVGGRYNLEVPQVESATFVEREAASHRAVVLAKLDVLGVLEYGCKA